MLKKSDKSLDSKTDTGDLDYKEVLRLAGNVFNVAKDKRGNVYIKVNNDTEDVQGNFCHLAYYKLDLKGILSCVCSSYLQEDAKCVHDILEANLSNIKSWFSEVV